MPQHPLRRQRLIGRPAHSREQVLQAVEKGVTRTGAATVLGVHPVTMWEYAKRWKSVAEALARKRRELVDLAEMRLRGAVLRGEPWAVAFALRTLGKEEGYSERIEHTGPQGGAIPIEHDLAARVRADRAALDAYHQLLTALARHGQSRRAGDDRESRAVDAGAAFDAPRQLPNGLCGAANHAADRDDAAPAREE